MFQLINPRNRFLPFQIVRPADPGVAYTWHLYSAVDDTFVSVITFPAGQIDTATVDSLDYITYFGTDIFGANMDCGKYWIKWTDGTLIKYSEVITIREVTDDTFVGLLLYGDSTQIVLYDLTEYIKTL